MTLTVWLSNRTYRPGENSAIRVIRSNRDSESRANERGVFNFETKNTPSEILTRKQVLLKQLKYHDISNVHSHTHSLAHISGQHQQHLHVIVQFHNNSAGNDWHINCSYLYISNQRRRLCEHYIRHYA